MATFVSTSVRSPQHLDELRAALRERAADLAQHLLGPPNRALSSKCELRYGNKGSFALQIAGDKRGLWYDHEVGGGGNIFDLIKRERSCDFRAAVDFARDFVGSAVPSSGRPKTKPKPAPDAWSRIWRESVDPRETLVEVYLRSRCLSLPDGVAGHVIRFHSALYHDGERRPGMVALFRDIATDAPCGIHQTFLNDHGGKIDRRIYGSAKCAAIKLDADENVTEGLHIGEGVETCIAAMLAGYRPTWALGSAAASESFRCCPVSTRSVS